MPDKFVPSEALDYIKNKKLKVGFSYKDVWNEEHATAFTVAKAMQLDVLSDIKSAVETAIKDGHSFEHFKKDLQPTLIKKGWWGRKKMTDPLTGEEVNAQLGSDRRLKTIYDTNLRSAYQKAQYERTMESDLHPYLMYRVGNSAHHRPQHLAWDGLILPKGDPFWDKHLPPNEYGCKCFTRAVSESKKRRYERDGIKIPPKADGSGAGVIKVKTKAPAEEYTTYFNERKGFIERIPKGVAPGFNWNQGKTGRDFQSAAVLFNKAEEKFPEQLEELAKVFFTNTIKQSEFDNFVDLAYKGQINGDYSAPAGFIDPAIRGWLKRHKNIAVPAENNIIALEARLIRPGSPKADRHSKAGDAIGKNGAHIITETLLYGNVYLDTDEKLIYLFPHSAQRFIKITVALSTRLKTRQTAIDTAVIRNIQTIGANRNDTEYMRITEKLEKIR
ncbi:MAG: phage head morphogenesis protein [Treponema sp.]